MKPSSLNAERRRRELDELAAGDEVDVLVIGGGITGVGVALDAASRGLSVALVERRDLAHGTSRWSSKLVHGGLRYLAKGEVGIAHESAVERGILMERTAPHLTRPLAFLAPAGAGFTVGEACLTGAGFLAADVLRVAAGTSRRTLPRPRWITAAETGLLAPALDRDRLRGAVMYWDGQLADDARLVVAVARTAAAHGARILTYCAAADADGSGATVTDELGGASFRLRARHVVNATGVWADTLDPQVRLRPSKGAHLVLHASRLGYPRAAVTVPVPGARNRFVFLLPQPDGQRVYLGLTDDPVTAVSDEPVADEADETFLLEVASQAFASPLTPADIIGSFAGLRPLIADADGPTADLSRRHAVLERADGLVTIVGGKLTTYRRMAQDTVDRIARRPGVTAGRCVTGRLPLVGAAPRPRLDEIGAPRHLVDRYGGEAPEVLAEGGRKGSTAVVPDAATLRAELTWAVAHEGALTVDDLLDRRTRVGLVPSERAAAAPVAEEVLVEARVRGVPGQAG